MIIPARFRDELGNRFVVTRGLDGCLRTYTMAQWDAVFEQLKRLPSTKRRKRRNANWTARDEFCFPPL